MLSWKSATLPNETLPGSTEAKNDDRPHLEGLPYLSGRSATIRSDHHPATRSLMDKLGSLGFRICKAGGTSDAN